MKDKVGKIEDIKNAGEIQVNLDDGAANVSTDFDDIINVLLTFGFSRQEANKALSNIDTDGKDESKIIKEALKNLNR